MMSVESLGLGSGSTSKTKGSPKAAAATPAPAYNDDTDLDVMSDQEAFEAISVRMVAGKGGRIRRRVLGSLTCDKIALNQPLLPSSPLISVNKAVQVMWEDESTILMSLPWMTRDEAVEVAEVLDAHTIAVAMSVTMSSDERSKITGRIAEAIESVTETFGLVCASDIIGSMEPLPQGAMMTRKFFDGFNRWLTEQNARGANFPSRIVGITVKDNERI